MSVSFSPIKDIKIDWDLARQTILDTEYDEIDAALVEGFDFKFFVNNEWVNWRLPPAFVKCEKEYHANGISFLPHSVHSIKLWEYNPTV